MSLCDGSQIRLFQCKWKWHQLNESYLAFIQLNGWGLRCVTLAASTQLTWVWRAFGYRVSSLLWATGWWFRSQTGTCPDSGNSQKKGTPSTCNSCPAWSLKELQVQTRTFPMRFSQAFLPPSSAKLCASWHEFPTRLWWRKYRTRPLYVPFSEHEITYLKNYVSFIEENSFNMNFKMKHEWINYLKEWWDALLPPG